MNHNQNYDNYYSYMYVQTLNLHQPGKVVSITANEQNTPGVGGAGSQWVGFNNSLHKATLPK